MSYRQPFFGDYPITQKYGESVTADFHTGIDYACPIGTPILASEAGTIKAAGMSATGYGYYITILHPDGRATLYAHLGLIPDKIRPGISVSRGQLIGYSGSTGNSTGPHLHFEARMKWTDHTSHFDPFTLPLQTVLGPDPAPEPAADGAAEPATGLHTPTPGPVRVVAPLGAKVFTDAGNYCGLTMPGDRYIFTGETRQANGYTYAKLTPETQARWVAIHDNDTQIIDNI